MKTRQGHGPRSVAVMFDETHPLANEVFAVARTIGTAHPLPLQRSWPNEKAPAPQPRVHNIDLICGSEVNTLVLATTRALRGKMGRVALEAAVPYDSLVAVEQTVRRLRDFGILNEQGTYLTDAPWKVQLEKLLDGYLRLRPEIRRRITERTRTKKKQRLNRLTETLFGFHSIEQVLVALAVHGPMTRVRLRSITMMTHQNTTLDPLTAAGILAVESRTGSDGRGTRAHGTRKQLVVGLNSGFPAYKELRAVLRALDGQAPPAKGTGLPREISSPRTTYDATALFSTAPLLWALLMMNAVPERELDVASLQRLRPKHAAFTFHGRMHWLLKQGVVTRRREGLILYYGLNPEHRLHQPLKRLLDRIGKVWPDMVAAAEFNDQIKSARRLVIDDNARRRAAASKTPFDPKSSDRKR